MTGFKWRAASSQLYHGILKSMRSLGKDRSIKLTDLGEEMMDDVIMGDIVQEKSSLPAEEWSVNGRGSTSLESEGRSAVVRKTLVLRSIPTDAHESINWRKAKYAQHVAHR
jgi:hypothetical protein